jgi:hypothetical protein
VAPELYGVDWIYLFYLLRSLLPPTSTMLQSSQSQPLLSPEELSDTEENLPSPPPLPGEPRRLRSQTMSLASTTASESSGGQSTCSSSRGRGTLPPPPRSDHSATPITPSRNVTRTARARTPTSRVSAPTSPNSYAVLGEGDRSPDTATAEIPPGPPTSASADGSRMGLFSWMYGRYHEKGNGHCG